MFIKKGDYEGVGDFYCIDFANELKIVAQPNSTNKLEHKSPCVFFYMFEEIFV